MFLLILPASSPSNVLSPHNSSTTQVPPYRRTFVQQVAEDSLPRHAQTPDPTSTPQLPKIVISSEDLCNSNSRRVQINNFVSPPIAPKSPIGSPMQQQRSPFPAKPPFDACFPKEAQNMKKTVSDGCLEKALSKNHYENVYQTKQPALKKKPIKTPRYAPDASSLSSAKSRKKNPGQ